MKKPKRQAPTQPEVLKFFSADYPLMMCKRLERHQQKAQPTV
jgi:hypothetical protein